MVSVKILRSALLCLSAEIHKIKNKIPNMLTVLNNKARSV